MSSTLQCQQLYFWKLFFYGTQKFTEQNKSSQARSIRRSTSDVLEANIVDGNGRYVLIHALQRNGGWTMSQRDDNERERGNTRGLSLAERAALFPVLTDFDSSTPGTDRSICSDSQ